MKQCDDCCSYYSEGRSYCPYCGEKIDEYDEDYWGYDAEDYWDFNNAYWGFDDDYNEDNYNEEEF